MASGGVCAMNNFVQTSLLLKRILPGAAMIVGRDAAAAAFEGRLTRYLLRRVNTGLPWVTIR